MTVYDADFYAADELEDFEEWDDEDFEELDDELGWDAEDPDEFDWARALNTAATFGEGVYGNYGSKWGKKNKLWDSAIRGALGAIKGASKTWFKDGIDGDPYEPEYETDEIDAMEVIAEDALDGDDEERSMAADELVARSFGPARHSRQVRPVLMALRQQVQRILVAARRNPRLRQMARIAPLALRRTSVIVTRMAMARRPVSVALAMRIFRGLLSRMMRSRPMQSRAVAMARHRAARARAQGGHRRRAVGRPPRRRPPSRRRHPGYPGHPPMAGPRPAHSGGRAMICYPMRRH
ncbi:MAG: hypothetical protein LJE68_17115 [Rhodobacter sp.]|nr:hypothetical protein [Rhodobacter sp.]